MLCLCGKPTDGFWRCEQDPGCGFSCPEDEVWLYDRAVKKFLATKQDRPKCCAVTPEASERNYAKFGVLLVPNGLYVMSLVAGVVSQILAALFSSVQKKKTVVPTSRWEMKLSLMYRYVNTENHVVC